MSLHSYPTNSHYKFKQKDLIKVKHLVHCDLECIYMIPCKSRFPCIGFPRRLVGVTSLQQYKTFKRM
jgi:hypothetical protein